MIFILLICSLTQAGDRIVFFGDSLISPTDSFAFSYEVATGKKSFVVAHAGYTAHDALPLLQTILNIEPTAVVISLGANDTFRNRPFIETLSSLEPVFKELRQRKVAVYYLSISSLIKRAKDREAAVIGLCEKYGVNVIKGVFEGLEKKKDYHDRVHPNPRGHKKILKRVRKALEAK